MSTDSIDFGHCLERLADRHADLLALDWRRRGRLLESPTSDFADLTVWDARMAATLAALNRLGSPAARHMRRFLGEPLSSGTAFALILYGFERTGVDSRDELLDAGVAVARSLPHLHTALISAIEWAARGPGLERVVASLPLPLRFTVLSARYRDLPLLVEPAFAELRHAEPEPDVLCAALRCLQCLGDAHRAQAGIHHLGHADARLKAVAAETLLALGSTQQATPAVTTLLQLVQEDHLAAREAAVRCLALHVAPASWMSPVAESLRSTSSGRRLYLQALGWAGDIDAVPELIAHLDDPIHSRIAAASLSLILGSDPVRDGWQGEAPTPVPAPVDADSGRIPPSDPDARLSWPSRAAFTARWHAIRGRFVVQGPWLGGHLTTPQSLAAVLRSGPLGWRPMAAARLQRLSGRALFSTHLSAPSQQALFNTIA